MKNGNFVYHSKKVDIKVSIDRENQTEYYVNGKYYVKSNLTWINECEYEMTPILINYPSFKYKIGDTINVKINKIKDNYIFYTTSIKNKSWKGIFRKVKSF